MLKRRELVSEGYVVFPFNDNTFRHTGEGGLCVKLVVLDELSDRPDDSLAVCCGASVFDVLQEGLVGDDLRPIPAESSIAETASPAEIEQSLSADASRHRNWVQFHFPRYGSDDADAHLSRNYRASIVLGTTGWSGYSDEKGYWHATYNDLTAEGKSLYRLMEQLNPGCAIHLLTFLDT